MPNLKALKAIAIIFAVIIVVLLSVLIFVKPVRGPELPPPAVSLDGRLSVTLPRTNDIVASPVFVGGSVTGGGWFFEASFPVKVLDGDGTVLGQGPAQAESDWMTTETVPFAADIPFTAPKYGTGTVVFEKDNPSGLPQNAGELRVPVRFAK